MKIEELRELARAAEPLSALYAALDGRVRTSQRDLVFRLLERLAKARSDLVLDESVGSDLEEELRLLAEALPPARRRAEAGNQDGSSGRRP